MKANDREFNQSPLYQGEDEKVYYDFATTEWGSSPASVSVVIKDSQGNDVTSAVTSGSIVVSGDTITLPQIRNLRKGERYRVEVKFTVDGNELEPYLYINAQE